MTSLSIVWLKLVALLAIEVGLVVLTVALAQRWIRSTAWRRTLCQTAVIALLVLLACELSGSARLLTERFAASGSTASPLPSITTPSVIPARSGTPGPSKVPTTAEMATSNTSGADCLDNGIVRQAPEVSPLAPQTRPKMRDRLEVQALAGPRAHSNIPDRLKPKLHIDNVATLWICMAWAAGTLFLCGRVAVARCLFIVFRRRCRPIHEPALLCRLETLGQTVGLLRRVRIFESPRLPGPIAFGLFQPTIGLPSNFSTRFDHAQQDAMLAHELAHLAAHDPFWCFLADLAAAGLWWHPGAWWLRRQLHLASEMVADEASLAVADGPRVLAECLVQLGSSLVQPGLGQLHASGFRSHLGRRVQRLVMLDDGAISQPHGLAVGFVRTAGPIALAAIVILGTAWAAPRSLTKGTSMKTMQLNWRRSLATLAVLAAFHGSQNTVLVAQTNNPPPLVPVDPSAVESAPEPVAQAAAPIQTSREKPALARRDRYSSMVGAGVIAPAGAALPTTPPGAPVVAAPIAASLSPGSQPGEGAMRVRYGTRAAGVNEPAPAERGALLRSKLERIVLDEVSSDGLPLNEVLRFLSNASVEADPEKTGVNFLINPNPPAEGMPTIKPTTGLLGGPAREAIELDAVTIRFSLPLRHVTMKDVLDAIVKVADHPIEYTVENYAVVFSAKPVPAVIKPAADTRPLPQKTEPMGMPRLGR